MESMQFERAEFSAASAMACGNCQSALLGNYFQLNGASICETCAGAANEVIHGKGSRLGRFAKACLLGSGAAVLASLAYYAITTITGYNLALVSIGVGIFVGAAVRRGSGGRGGWRYQIIAALLTYMAIGGTFIPEAITAINKTETTSQVAPPVAGVGHATAAFDEGNEAIARAEAQKAGEEVPPHFISPLAKALGIAFASLFSLIAGPVLVGMEAPLSLLIYGFGVWQAWKSNRKVDVQLTGPHAIGARPSSEALA